MRNLILTAGAIWLLSANAAAQPAVPAGELPAALAGQWVYTAPNGRRFDGKVRLVRGERQADGTFQGKLTYFGRTCVGTDLPATLRADGGALTVVAKFDEGDACGTMTMKLQRTDRSGAKMLYEGTSTSTGTKVGSVVGQIYFDPE